MPALREAETGINDLLEHQARFASGDDDYTRQAVDYLSAELERDDLAALRRDALATPFPDDDQIVSRLLQAEQERRQLSFTIENLKQTRAKQQQKLEELSRLQRDFKRQRMDRGDSGFADGAMLAMMLTNFHQRHARPRCPHGRARTAATPAAATRQSHVRFRRVRPRYALGRQRWRARWQSRQRSWWAGWWRPWGRRLRRQRRVAAASRLVEAFSPAAFVACFAP